MVVGVDSIAIAGTLWQDHGVRSAVAGASQGGAGGGLKQAVDTLSHYGLPLGWSGLPSSPTVWFLKVVGLAITALALSLGAPFWFDLFKLFSNPRQTGPQPKRPGDNGSASLPKNVP